MLKHSIDKFKPFEEHPKKLFFKEAVAMLKIILLILGIIIASMGIVGFMFPEISFNSVKPLIDFGPFNAAIDVTEIYHIPRLLSSSLLGLGLLILILAALKKAK